jgi:hypothetical protein
MTTPRRNYIMAKVLAETVVEISNEELCRRCLKFAGFSDGAIKRNLTSARDMARNLRINEIEQRVHRELKK